MAEPEWTEVAWLEPKGEDNRMSEVPSVLDSWLAERGLSRDDVSDEDIRLDLTYLGAERGVCGTLISIRTEAIKKAR